MESRQSGRKIIFLHPQPNTTDTWTENKPIPSRSLESYRPRVAIVWSQLENKVKHVERLVATLEMFFNN